MSDSRFDQFSEPRIDRQPMKNLDASDDDPKLNATTIAEFVFCPRAGLLTYEGGQRKEDEELPALGLLPWYERDAIEKAYAKKTRDFVWLMFFWAVGLVILCLIPLFRTTLFPVVVIGYTAVCLYCVVVVHRDWRELRRRLLAANSPNICHPDPNSKTLQVVDWWGLLNAGYEVRRPKEALYDSDWKLSGKPKRILHKGSLAIPVHHIKNVEGRLSPQHLVRVMIHCHLIGVSEGATVPFAIILFGNSYQGTTVPNTREHRELFYDALRRVRTLVLASRVGQAQPSEPRTGSICRACPHGRSRPVSRGERTLSHGHPLTPLRLVRGQSVRHCDCGDRFDWMPPHEGNLGYQPEL